MIHCLYLQLLALSLGCLQLVHAASIAAATTAAEDNVNNNNSVGQRQKRRAQDEILPVDYDSNTVYFRVQKPSLRSLSQPAQAQYNDFLRVLYQNDRTRSSQYGRRRRDVGTDDDVTAAADRLKRGIIFRPLFVYQEKEIRRKKVRTTKPVPKQYAPAKPSTAQIYQQAIMSGQRQQFAG